MEARLPYMFGMKHMLIIAGLAIASTPAAAQDSSVEDGFDLLGEGTRLLLEGLLEEMGPALRELQETLQGLDAYEAPEVLPNGDIIIRRKTPIEVAPEEDGEPVEI